MELHHDKHHNTYVNSYNQAAEKYAEAESKNDIAGTIALQPLINFHGGGHINHSLFWENLAPKNKGGGEPPSGALSKAINETYGSLDEMKKKFNTALAGIQGSGWAWLVKDKQTGQIVIKTYAVSKTLLVFKDSASSAFRPHVPPFGQALILLRRIKTRSLANISLC
jgi:superoxide dismutase, Fe-Mn family